MTADCGLTDWRGVLRDPVAVGHLNLGMKINQRQVLLVGHYALLFQHHQQCINLRASDSTAIKPYESSSTRTSVNFLKSPSNDAIGQSFTAAVAAITQSTKCTLLLPYRSNASR